MIYPAPPPEPRPKKPVAPIARTAVKRVNAKRKAAEFKRCYHSKERVEFVKSLACIVCQCRPSENAHTENGGKSRKGHYTTIVPLCGEGVANWAFIGHHRTLDLSSRPDFEEHYQLNLKTAAAETEKQWQLYLGEHPSK